MKPHRKTRSQSEQATRDYSAGEQDEPVSEVRQPQSEVARISQADADTDDLFRLLPPDTVWLGG
jgi:hypothetical protein